jgi:hypothetical protein
MSTPVRVRADTTRLRGSTQYTGTIMVSPDHGTQDIAVKVKLNVLGFATMSGQSTSGQPEFSQGTIDENDLTSQQSTTSTQKSVMVAPGTSKGGVNSPTGPTGQVKQPYTSAKDSEYKAKYGLPGSDGWQVMQTTPRQAARLHYAMTFFTACMVAAFYYLILSHISPSTQSSLLPPSPWFLGVLIGLVPFATLGAMIANWGSKWSMREIISRATTGLTAALVLLAISEWIWQTLLGGFAPPLHLAAMLLITAAAATIGTSPGVSNRILNTGMWMMQHMRWVVIGVVVVVGGGLGFALTSGIAFGCFTPFGVLLGVGVAVALVIRLDRLIKQRHPHP